MPVIKLQHICSVSSEDPSHPAENLLNAETYRKWKCASAGEKQAVAVFQLEKATQIHSVDIGNDGSAFVEVFVGRSSAPDDYQVLLVTSTFMTPGDSKSWSNTSRVRIFGKEKLTKSVAEQRWDRMKVVCTQPYNKTEKYGLSFIKLHSPPSSEDDSPSKGPTKLGVFSLHDDPKDLPAGSLFRKEHSKPTTHTSPTTMAAQARMASAAALKTSQTGSSRKTGTQSPSVSRKKSPARPLTSDASPDTPNRTLKTKPAESRTTGTPPAKRSKVGDSTPTKTETEDFSRVMKGVVFTLSGFKNPFRGELREKAMEMGADYQPDWTPKCTHLICAFPNTPKFNQVKAKQGLVVRKEWVMDSYVKKKRLPARKYRLSAETGDSSSEDELYDRKESEIFKKAAPPSSKKAPEASPASKTPTKPKLKSTPFKAARGALTTAPEGIGVSRDDSGSTLPLDKSDGGEDPYGGSTDEEGEPMETGEVVKLKPLPPTSRVDTSSECDTEDEIERVKEEQRKKESRGTGVEEDQYGGSTEEESDKDTPMKNSSPSKHPKKSLLNLPDFFTKFSFLLYGTFSESDRRLIVRYITAYNGHVEDYMSDQVTHVVTQEKWDSKFDQALSENSALIFVKPKWIFSCHQKQSRIPSQPFAVVPS